MSTAEDRHLILQIKGVISELPREQQELVAQCAESLRAMTSDAVGLLAFALVGAELQSKG